MRFVIQRVQQASVRVEGEITGQIETGFLVLMGVCLEDDTAVADQMLRKLVGLRIFADKDGKTNLSLTDVGGAVLMVSQFTLYADCRKGNRPSFTASAPAGQARQLYEYVVEQARKTGLKVETGVFGAHMEVSLVNDGPFTVILDSREL